MKKTFVVVLMFFALGTAFGEEKVKLSSVKDKQMIRCLSNYIKNHKTHVTMIVNEKGERELLIPKSYLTNCKGKLK